ncbi:elongator complex protein 3 [Anaerosphaera multitolerans]|uniref:Radical SAM protein n=1 Tax=Anaerosphaera multitolerans TaxID=2487351 RepID=A0A437S8Y8_9FIRM|nr:radical SAM protein [Anaerosphaera multitolerans]RVU55298.1 radical SAM protein [Anaerosphaera multitolerans]
MSKKNIIPIFVPHLGCPNDCVFCNQKKITAVSTNVSTEDVYSIIEEYLGYFKDKKNIEVAFYGGSFTAIDQNIQRELLTVIKEYKKKKIISEIRISTRPDCIDNEVLDILKFYLVDTIELGVQSLDENVLNRSNRGHDSSCVYRASKLIKEYGFNLGLQQMLGLPGDTLEKSLYTAREFIKIDPDFVRIYPTLVIKETQLLKDLENGLYSALTLEEAVNMSKEVLKVYIINNIPVIRIGLQPTDNIQLNKDVVTGPFHPSIRQLVEGEILFEVLKNYFNDLKVEDGVLSIFASGKNISSLSGQKGTIKRKITDALNLKRLKLREKNIGNENLILNYNNLEKEIKILDFITLERTCI